MLSKLSTRRSIIYSAILKHGHNNFSLEIIEYYDKKSLINREQYYLNLLEPKYNILKTANSRLGSKQTIETRIKISSSLKGEKNHFFGKIDTDYTKTKIS